MMTDEQNIRRALELVRDGLRSGEIPAHNFSMNEWLGYRHCGTVGCIGGYTQLLLRRAGLDHLWQNIPYPDVLGDGRLGELFYQSPYDANATIPSKSADAIDRYLSGKKTWPVRL